MEQPASSGQGPRWRKSSRFGQTTVISILRLSPSQGKTNPTYGSGCQTKQGSATRNILVSCRRSATNSAGLSQQARKQRNPVEQGASRTKGILSSELPPERPMTANISFGRAG